MDMDMSLLQHTWTCLCCNTHGQAPDASREAMLQGNTKEGHAERIPLQSTHRFRAHTAAEHTPPQGLPKLVEPVGESHHGLYQRCHHHQRQRDPETAGQHQQRYCCPDCGSNSKRELTL